MLKVEDGAAGPQQVHEHCPEPAHERGLFEFIPAITANYRRGTR